MPLFDRLAGMVPPEAIASAGNALLEEREPEQEADPRGLFERLIQGGGDALLEAGHRLRYGVPTSGRTNMEALGNIPGLDPAIKADLQSPDESKREHARHETKRATSAALSGRRFGPAPAMLGNLLRETSQGIGTLIGSGGQQFLAKPGDPDEGQGFDLQALSTVADVSRAVDEEARKRQLDQLRAALTPEAAKKLDQPPAGVSLLRGLFNRR